METKQLQAEQGEVGREQEILNSLSGFSGSENFYKDNFVLRKSVYTDGFKAFMELCECEWLYSDMSVYCSMKLLNKEDFIICRIVKHEDKSAEVFLYSDYSEDNEKFNKEHLLYTQKYRYTDFPLSEYSFYICFNELNKFTFMLKSEY